MLDGLPGQVPRPRWGPHPVQQIRLPSTSPPFGTLPSRQVPCPPCVHEAEPARQQPASWPPEGPGCGRPAAPIAPAASRASPFPRSPPLCVQKAILAGQARNGRAVAFAFLPMAWQTVFLAQLQQARNCRPKATNRAVSLHRVVVSPRSQDLRPGSCRSVEARAMTRYART